MSLLKPIALDRTTITAQVVEHLRTQIVNGTLAAGSPLPESRVGQWLGVSRVPVREALAMLEREGLVVFNHRGTARVAAFGPADIRELGFMRVALESVGTRLACTALNEAWVEALQNNLRQLKGAKSLTDVTRLDVAFHEIIIRASGNSRLQIAYRQLASQFVVVMGLFHRAIEAKTRITRDLTYRSHEQLLNAMLHDEAAAVENLARQHAESWLQGWPAA